MERANWRCAIERSERRHRRRDCEARDHLPAAAELAGWAAARTSSARSVVESEATQIRVRLILR